jgi:squalene-hopene/tetraprenyl-beta-curcumene cyclase
MVRLYMVLVAGMLAILSPAFADEQVTLENVQNPGPNRLDEPIAKTYSQKKAIHFLDSAALSWQKERKCFTCHTNYAHLYARPLVGADAPAARQVRQDAEELVTTRWKEKGPRWEAEVVATAAALAFNDAATTGNLHATTREALDRMWKLQRADGGWNWIKCNWPPMESDDDYGACLAALGAAVAPENYCASDAAKAGLEKIRGYLAKHPPPSLHHEAMLLWASTYGEPMLSLKEQEAVAAKLRAAQQSDGGWAVSSLGNWRRADGSAQSTDSDGYGTGFVVYVLRRAGAAADDAAIHQGLDWLKTHQRESGRWITRSLRKDGNHFLSHAGSAFAVMAIASSEAEVAR